MATRESDAILSSYADRSPQEPDRQVRPDRQEGEGPALSGATAEWLAGDGDLLVQVSYL